jgi:hypothetical protein
VFIRINGGGSKLSNSLTSSLIILKLQQSPQSGEAVIAAGYRFSGRKLFELQEQQNVKDFIQQRKRSNDADFQVKENWQSC